MTTQVSRRWRPRSLWQLVLLAFIAVMLPLGILMFQASQALSELTRLADVSARQAVEETRRARTLSTLALELERSARQYAVVEQEGLLDIFSDRLDEFSELLDQQRRLLPDNPNIAALDRQVEELKQLPELPIEEFREALPQFSTFAQHTDAVRVATNSQIDNRIDSIRDRASTVQTRVWLQTGALVSASLSLMLLFSWLINRPVRQIERRILSLGSVGTKPDPVPIQGPAELVSLGDRLDWLSSRLSELEAQKQQFLRHMSHELKTPLASVREGTALLDDGVAGELTPRQREIVDLIDRSSQELQNLIEELLDYNLLQHHKSSPGGQRFDLATVVKELLAKHQLALEHKGMQVIWFDAPLEWQADRAATGRILDNLLSNAIAYGEDGGYLEIRAQYRGHSLVVEVANSGDAIADADRPRLFEAFYQGRVKRKGPLKGSGIGLSVAADCAASQQGSLELVDDDRMPVCFRLTLPWLPAESQSVGADTRPSLTVDSQSVDARNQ
ncbi:sensor histidine kinase [Aidingimonas lacisalsi]|uniref:sensor histidine kinase n=1 Tax=Aidingimonas lacisalsi TaxID=2604086 RepID=UPI0011D1AF0C|nr:HAMP domain-containing sensor histidine kinase [Aidingimonas lacisalsi]